MLNMNKTLFIQLLATSAARIVLGYFAIKMGLKSAEYGPSIEGFAIAFGSTVGLGCTLVWSMIEKKKLIAMLPETTEIKP